MLGHFGISAIGGSKNEGTGCLTCEVPVLDKHPLWERDEERVARYINGSRYEIQDELSMMLVRNVEDAYQFALKAEEKLARKHNQRGRGKGSIPSKSKEFNHDRAHQSKDEAEKPHNHSGQGGSSRGR
jgi:hypothetical protein